MRLAPQLRTCTHRALLALLTLGLVVALSGCGSDSSENGGNGGNGGNNGADAGDTGGGGADADYTVPDGHTWESEHELRFTSFAFNEGTTGSNLNNLLATRFDQTERYPVVILIHLKDIDAEQGTLQIRGGAGLKADLECNPDPECEYVWNTAAEQWNDGDFTGETGRIDGLLESLDLIATFETESGTEDAVIPIKELEFGANLQPSDGSVTIPNGTLKGYVTRADADASQVQLAAGSDPIPLTNILGRDEMNLDLDGDGAMDAWQLEGTFAAQGTTIVEPQ